MFDEVKRWSAFVIKPQFEKGEVLSQEAYSHSTALLPYSFGRPAPDRQVLVLSALGVSRSASFGGYPCSELDSQLACAQNLGNKLRLNDESLSPLIWTDAAQ